MKRVSLLVLTLLLFGCSSMDWMGDSSGGGMDGSSATSTSRYPRPLQPGDIYYGG